MKSPQLSKLFGPKPFAVKLVTIIVFLVIFITCIWLFVFRGHTEITYVGEYVPGVNTCGSYLLENGMRLEENCRLEAIPGYKSAEQRQPNADVVWSPQKGDRVVVFTELANIKSGTINKTVFRLPF